MEKESWNRTNYFLKIVVHWVSFLKRILLQGENWKKMSEDSGCLTCLYPESDDVRLKYHYPIELGFRFDLPLPMSHFSCRRFFLIFTFYLSSVLTPYSWKWRITVQFILVLYICKIIIISLILILKMFWKEENIFFNIAGGGAVSNEK